MLVVHSADHARHAPLVEVSDGIPIPAYEIPARADAIVAALRAAGHEIRPPDDHSAAPIEAVHAPAMVQYLESAWDEWTAASQPQPAIVPDTLLLDRYRGGMGKAPEPQSPCGRVGYWCFDTMTPILAGTYEAARAAVDVALSTANAVVGGRKLVYGLCRPPGHHAGSDLFGGYCYFNNAAIAAEWLVVRGAGRVGILDVDYHHGNGTQQIFWERGDVPYASLHADPRRAYPYFSGHADERGGRKGKDATFNQPLAAGTTDDEYLAALERVLDWLEERTDEVLVVSLGLDTYGLDPIGDFALTSAVYGECGRLVASIGRRLVILQEGGYHVADLGTNVAGWLRGAEEASER